MNGHFSRRKMLQYSGLALASGMLTQPGHAAAELPRKILFFTKSAGFEHSVIHREGNELRHAERILIELGREHGFDVTATKDGTIFDGDLDEYRAFVFYTTGDLTTEGNDKQPPMSAKGKQALLDAVHAGKGFVASHCGSDTFHSAGDAWENQEKKDPYIEMLGGEFISHGEQQEARMAVADPHFPGIEPAEEGFVLLEEWYSLKNFAPDLHVLLVNETAGMRGKDYNRPAFPATWARKHGKGRVFYTSMGHREDVWTHKTFQSVLLGGLRWAAGVVDADVTPNIDRVTPHASMLQNE
jgi:type 1 glutamine amidotransferase